jgi:hypothetical protein
MSFLKSYMPTLRNASQFCFDLIDDKEHMLDAPGSLMASATVQLKLSNPIQPHFAVNRVFLPFTASITASTDRCTHPLAVHCIHHCIHR